MQDFRIVIRFVYLRGRPTGRFIHRTTEGGGAGRGDDDTALSIQRTVTLDYCALYKYSYLLT